ncbi:hypothetical protein MUP77_21010 [Candidatus Bathyarchaeota archaeon]|nr:hypothetical protein [Candidatus Bathyarchaeota archaeon]
MTLDEAIERNYTTAKELSLDGSPTRARAVRLGIEALKAYRQARQEGQLSPKELLLGETEK